MRASRRDLFRRLGIMLIAMTGLASASGGPAAAFGPVVTVQGGVTLYLELLIEHHQEIESAAGVSLMIVPNRASIGLTALLDGATDLAMSGTPLDNEREALRRARPGADLDLLQAFKIGRTRAALIVHPSNTMRAISDADLPGVLSGEITNWHALGGPDLPIRIFAVGYGDGVIATVEAAAFGPGRRMSAANSVRMQNAQQVVRVVEQEPGALGIVPLRLTVNRQVAELRPSHPIEQPLFLVSLGEPSLPVQAVIDACVALAAEVGLQ